jgi:iron complex transport system substrate-binding protein
MKQLGQRAARNAQSFHLRCALTVARCALLMMTAVIIAPNIYALDELGGKPEKIVSINLCTDELLLQLVAPERVAAVTKFSADPEVSTVADSAKDIKKIQGGIEAVQACGPDLLIGGKFSNKETLRFFKSSGIPVLTFGLPRNFEDIYADIRKLAEAVGETPKGEAIIRQMRTELAVLKPEPLRNAVILRPQAEESKSEILRPLRTQDDDRKSFQKRAFFFQSGGLVPGSGTFENAIMEAAGLENLAVTAGIRDYGSLSLEKLIGMRPDVLIFSSDQKQKPTVRGEVLHHPAIRKALPGVKTVTLPPAILNCGSPASVEAVRILVRETTM